MVPEMAVLELLDPYLEQGMDSYYNSLKLSQKPRGT
jgi:hypothetical protein